MNKTKTYKIKFYLDSEMKGKEILFEIKSDTRKNAIKKFKKIYPETFVK